MRTFVLEDQGQVDKQCEDNDDDNDNGQPY